MAISLPKGEVVLTTCGLGMRSPICLMSCFLFILMMSSTASSECLNLCESTGVLGLSFLFSLRFTRNASVTSSKAVCFSLFLSVLLPGHSTLCSKAALMRCSESSMLLNRPATWAGDPLREDPLELPWLRLEVTGRGFSSERIREDSRTLANRAGDASREEFRLLDSSLEAFKDVPRDCPAEASEI